MKNIELSSLKEIKIFSYDIFTDKENGIVTREYFDGSENQICMIDYSIFSGQINFLFVFDKKMLRKGLGKHMLLKAIGDMKQNKLKNIWAITSKNHYFWENVCVYNKPFSYVEKSGVYTLKI